MRISFDLDETLILSTNQPSEPPPPLWRRWPHSEMLRLGAVALMRSLADLDCSLWIYTTSFRSPRSIRRWARSYGIVLEDIVNQDRHDKVVGRSGPSKYPPAFGIDLHIDDLDGVAIEGERHGFDVLVIAPEDPDWSCRVLEAVQERRPVALLLKAKSDP